VKNSAATMARNECANFRNDACVFDRPCAVLDGQRCAYFEDAVLPLGGPRWFPEKYADTMRAYFRKHRINADETEDRLCECGAVLAPRARYCDACREKKRRATRRASYSRLSTGQLAENQVSQPTGA
jgi:hypothetical protein